MTGTDRELLEYVFFHHDLRTDWLIELVLGVLHRIGRVMELDEGELGHLFERGTISGEAREVNEDGEVWLAGDLLRALPREVAAAIVAHEFAHRYLRHFESGRLGDGLDREDEADEQARAWGFDVDEFRRVRGPATIR